MLEQTPFVSELNIVYSVSYLYKSYNDSFFLPTSFLSACCELEPWSQLFSLVCKEMKNLYVSAVYLYMFRSSTFFLSSSKILIAVKFGLCLNHFFTFQTKLHGSGGMQILFLFFWWNI